MEMANGMMEQEPKEFLNSSSVSAAQQRYFYHSTSPSESCVKYVRHCSSKMEVSEHPLPTPPSIPADNYDRPSEDPLSASPLLSHPAVVDAFTSDLRDQPPSPSALSPLHPHTEPTQRPPSPRTVEIAQADSSMEFDRPRSEPSMEMDVDEKPVATIELTNGRSLVNGHRDAGEYTAEDMFSGPAVESLEPTKPPTPPLPTSELSTASTSIPPPLPSLSQKAPPAATISPVPLAHPQTPLPPVPSAAVATTDVEMRDALSFTAAPKPVRGPPTPSDEPPAKRFKAEPSYPTYDTSKKLPANQQKFLVALLRQVKKSKDATPFREPVDPIKLNIPRYFETIARPMDISTIEKKLNGGEYPVAQALVDDFNLMVDNCVKFNGPENPVTKMGRTIQATFEKGIKSLPPEQVFRLPATTRSDVKAPPPPKPVAPPVVAAPTPFVPPKPKTPSSAPPRRPSGAVPPIRRESLTADGRPKREIKPPPERDIPMDKPRLRKKHAMELRFCGQVVKELQKKVHEPYSYPFLAPVDAVALQIPDYYKIIKQPMDLGTVDQKLKEQQYATADEFYADVKLVFKNCYKYNGMDSPVAKLAQQLERVFDKKWLEKPEEPPEKPSTGKRGPSSSPPQEEESSSDEDEIGRIQEQMTLMAKKLSDMQSRKKQRHEKSPKLQGKGSKGSTKKTQRSSSGNVAKPKKPKEVIPEVTFEQKRELSEKINFLSPSKMQGVLELIKDAMPLDSVTSSILSGSDDQAQEEIELDIDILPPKTLHALYMYVVKDTKVPNSSTGGNSKGGASKAPSKPKKKREVLTADAQNRKIAEIEGMLNSYDRTSMSSLCDFADGLEKPQAESDSEEESEDEVSSDDSD